MVKSQWLCFIDMDGTETDPVDEELAELSNDQWLVQVGCPILPSMESFSLRKYGRC